jgi:hypothetical protein
MMKDHRINQIYLIVDALDECQIELEPLLNLIAQSSSDSSLRVKWLVSSRHRRDIETQLRYSGCRTDLHLEQNADYVYGGVNDYIEYKMSDLFAQYREIYADRGPDVLKELQKVENEVAEELRGKADGTFFGWPLSSDKLKSINVMLTEFSVLFARCLLT